MNKVAVVFATNAIDLTLPPKTLHQAVDAFLVLHVGKLSNSYREWLTLRLGNLIRFLGPDTNLDEIEIWQLELWYSELSAKDTLFENHQYRETIERGLSAETLHGYIRAVKTLWNWLGKRRYITSNPASLLEPPPTPELPPRAPSEANVKKLLEYARSRSKRNYAAIRLLQATGIRACGLEGLALRDVTLPERWVFVREKGRGGRNKSRYVPFDERTAEALRDYLQNERPKKAPTDSFFVSENGRSAWTSQALYQVMRRYCLALDIPVINLHMLRHFFATQAVRRNVNIRVLQQLLGHSDVHTTERYTKFNPVQLHDSYDAAYTPDNDIETSTGSGLHHGSE